MTFQGPHFDLQPAAEPAATDFATEAAFSETFTFDRATAPFFAVTFTDAERDEIFDAFGRAGLFQARDRLIDFTVVSRAAFEMSAPLAVQKLLFDMRCGVRAPVAVAFKNLPSDEAFDGADGFTAALFNEAFLCAVGAQLGVPFGLEPFFVASGDSLCEAFEPQAFGADRQGFHMDTTALHGRDGIDRFPDWVALAAGRGPQDTPARLSIADGGLALASCPDWVEEALRTEAFVFGGREGFEQFEPGAKAGRCERFGLADFRFALQDQFAFPRDTMNEAAFNLFRQQLASTAFSFDMEPGTIVLIDNHFGFHTFEEAPQAAFAPLTRLFVTANRRNFVNCRRADANAFDEVAQ